MSIFNLNLVSVLFSDISQRDIYSIGLVAGIGAVFIMIVIWGVRFKPKMKRRKGGPQE
jgi:hypothetical protein